MPHHVSRKIILAALLTLCSPAFPSGKESQPPALTPDVLDDAAIERAMNPPGHVIILATSRDFLTLKREAQKIARAAGLPFSLRDMIYTKKDGLHFPHDAGPWADAYIFRRDDTITLRSGKESHFISIEKSDAYPGLKKGYYIVVGGICFTAKEVKNELALLRPAAPDTYAAKTTIYIGCME